LRTLFAAAWYVLFTFCGSAVLTVLLTTLFNLLTTLLTAAWYVLFTFCDAVVLLAKVAGTCTACPTSAENPLLLQASLIGAKMC
jgi:hypothetical protein